MELDRDRLRPRRAPRELRTSPAGRCRRTARRTAGVKGLRGGLDRCGEVAGRRLHQRQLREGVATHHRAPPGRHGPDDAAGTSRARGQLPQQEPARAEASSASGPMSGSGGAPASATKDWTSAAADSASCPSPPTAALIIFVTLTASGRGISPPRRDPSPARPHGRAACRRRPDRPAERRACPRDGSRGAGRRRGHPGEGLGEAVAGAGGEQPADTVLDDEDAAPPPPSPRPPRTARRPRRCARTPRASAPPCGAGGAYASGTGGAAAPAAGRGRVGGTRTPPPRPSPCCPGPRPRRRWPGRVPAVWAPPRASPRDDCELGVEDVDDARRQQEVAYPRRLRVQHLGAEVEGDVGAGEVDGIVQLTATAVVDADQPQARRPPPGPVGEGEDGSVGQLRLASGEQLPRLVGGEGELREPDLGNGPGETVLRQGEVGVDPRDQDEPQPSPRSAREGSPGRRRSAAWSAPRRCPGRERPAPIARTPRRPAGPAANAPRTRCCRAGSSLRCPRPRASDLPARTTRRRRAGGPPRPG